MDNFKNCNTKEEVMTELLKTRNHTQASQRFLELGFVDESIKFYLLAQQENLLENFIQQVATSEQVANNNRTAGYTMFEASENYKSATRQMMSIAEAFEETANKNRAAGNTMLQASENNMSAAQQIMNAGGYFQEASYRMMSAANR